MLCVAHFEKGPKVVFQMLAHMGKGRKVLLQLIH